MRGKTAERQKNTREGKYDIFPFTARSGVRVSFIILTGRVLSRQVLGPVFLTLVVSLLMNPPAADLTLRQTVKLNHINGKEKS